MGKKKPVAGIVMGSKSDWPVLEHTVNTFKEFGIECEVKIMSAHRTPHEVAAYAENAAKNGLKILIGAAGGAAHLSGVLAGHTTLPVIGVPVKGWALDGMDARECPWPPWPSAKSARLTPPCWPPRSWRFPTAR